MESFSPTSCFVDGGEELLITGTNMSAQSRVVFVEKGPGKILLCSSISVFSSCLFSLTLISIVNALNF